MTPTSLPPEDLPPLATTALDALLRQQLEQSTRQHFFENCDGPTQSLLMECRWTVWVAETLILVIHCPDQLRNWRVLNHLATLAECLAQFSPQAKIRVYPPAGLGTPFDFCVDERSVYRRPLE
ncbi:MAG: hypothetical protein ACTS3T_03105 [Almyronema sp.]